MRSSTSTLSVWTVVVFQERTLHTHVTWVQSCIIIRDLTPDVPLYKLKDLVSSRSLVVRRKWKPDVEFPMPKIVATSPMRIEDVYPGESLARRFVETSFPLTSLGLFDRIRGGSDTSDIEIGTADSGAKKTVSLTVTLVCPDNHEH